MPNATDKIVTKKLENCLSHPKIAYFQRGHNNEDIGSDETPETAYQILTGILTMRFLPNLLRSSLAALATLSCSLVQADDILMWATNGAGHRGFPVQAGLANLFQQLDLLTETSSEFKSISGASSAAWFLSQLFFSKPYYDRTVLSDPDELKDLMVDWFVAFGEIWNVKRDM